MLSLELELGNQECLPKRMQNNWRPLKFSVARGAYVTNVVSNRVSTTPCLLSWREGSMLHIPIPCMHQCWLPPTPTLEANNRYICKISSFVINKKYCDSVVKSSPTAQTLLEQRLYWNQEQWSGFSFPIYPVFFLPNLSFPVPSSLFFLSLAFSVFSSYIRR